MNDADPLSEALRSVRLTGAIFLDAELGTPWGFAAPPTSATSHLLAPTAEHLVLFHLLVEGQATARVPGYDSVTLEPGDIAVLARGDAHELWNGSVSELTDSSALLPKILNGAIASERGGGGGPVTKFICGYIGCERQAQRLFLAGLPPVFKVNIRREASGEWIESSIRHLASERSSTRRTKRAARQARGGAVHRDLAPLHGRAAAGRSRMVGSGTGSGNRTCAGGDPSRPFAGLDGRRAGEASWLVAERVR